MARWHLLAPLLLAACASQNTPPAEAPSAAPGPNEPAAESTPQGSPEGGLGLTGVPKDEPTRRIGTLPKEDIRATIQAAHPKIEACYHSAREQTPGLEGTLKLRFLIAEDGKVETPTVKSDSTITHEGMQRCMLDVFSALVFPSPKDGVVIVSYPFVFEYEDIRAKKPKPPEAKSP
jgi:hypothetical protein